MTLPRWVLGLLLLAGCASRSISSRTDVVEYCRWNAADELVYVKPGYRDICIEALATARARQP